MTGLLVENDKRNVQISSDVKQLMRSRLVHHDFNENNVSVPIGNEDGTFSVWHRSDTTNKYSDIGVFSRTTGATFLGKRKYVNGDGLKVDQHIFSSIPPPSSGVGLQMFDENGVETFNSDNPLLSIIDKVSIHVEDAYEKEWREGSDGTLYQDRTKWSKTYPGYSKLGILFANVPAGIYKSPNYYQIDAYAYNFMTVGNVVELWYRAEYFFWSGSSATITPNWDSELEFFVIDLSNA